MARLKVKLKGRLVTDLPLAEGQAYTAGRKEDCEIVLQPEKGISREHFRVSFEAGQWKVEILSRFGSVIYKGEKVESFTLEHGQNFLVPPYEFEFLETPADVAVAPSAQTEESSDPSAEAASGPVDEKTIVGIAPSVPFIKFVNKEGEATDLFRLEGGDSWTAGRESSSNIVINDSRVSRKQFEVKKINGSYFILDLGSSNGTLLNGNPISVSDPTPLRSGDAIQVLDNLIFFEIHDPNFQSRLERVHIPTPAENYSMVPVEENYNDYPVAPVDPNANAYPQGVVPFEQSQPQYPTQYQQPNYQVQNYNPYGNVPVPPLPNMAPAKKGPSPIMILIAVLVLGGAYLYSEQQQQEEAAKVAANKPAAANDPFSKLPPEKQMIVKQTYQLARNYYLQGKYELARAELVKMQEIIPEYDESKDIEKYCQAALYLAEQKRKQEQQEKDKAETEAKVAKVVAECRKKISPTLTNAQLDECLSPILAIDPNNAAINEMHAMIDKYEAERQEKAAKHAAYMAEVGKLRAIYDKAEQTAKVVHPLKAIEGYERVLDSKLPDPNGLKSKAERNIASLRNSMGSKAVEYTSEAEKFYQAQKLKEAVTSLKKARQIDPGNLELQEKIDRWTNELRKQMMVIYQEGVLEESFGNVDGSENRQGAKEKWKKILESDITDGEYYQKALIKIKKYGAQ